jgi:hypothetical protein
MRSSRRASPRSLPVHSRGRTVFTVYARRLVSVLFALIAEACTSTSNAAGNACRAASGVCAVNGGGLGCIKQASDDAQDCNPTLGPGAIRCCLEYADATGGGQHVQEARQGEVSSYAAGNACRAASGVCAVNGGGMGCIKQAPDDAQDCNPTLGPGAIRCCLEYADATGD